MPYIKARDKTRAAHSPETAGELNFQLTQVVQDYVHRNGLTYQTLNDVVGALEGAKAEFQRRVVGPYEDTKIATNGDVYDQDLLSRPDVGNPAV
jgi:hypothetical protein